jgi:hypothetical protein
MLAMTVFALRLSFSLYCFIFVCIERPEALASLLNRQSDFFQMMEEEHSDIDPSGGDERVLLAADTKGEGGNDGQKENVEMTRLDQNEEEANDNKKTEEEKDEEKKEKEQMDNDVSQKYPVIGTEEQGDKAAESPFPPIGTAEEGNKAAESPLPPADPELLLLVAVVLGMVTVVLGLVAVWYAIKVQHKRSGWHKKIDATLSLSWYKPSQGPSRPGPLGHRKPARR